ncbi:hypothetical protein [Pelagibacterium sp.]
MNFKLPDHADRRKTSIEAKRALLDKIKTNQKAHTATQSADKKTAK